MGGFVAKMVKTTFAVLFLSEDCEVSLHINGEEIYSQKLCEVSRHPDLAPGGHR
jgi:hypothetical protein